MIFLLVLFFIIGSAVGSFLNVVIDRSIRRESILGRSYCEHCGATLSTLDLVPIVSFVGLGARCRYCHKKLSWQYPIVETVTGLLFVLTFYSLASGQTLQVTTLMLQLFLISVFIVVSAIDIKFSLIPTTLVFLASLVVLFWDYFYLTSGEFVLAVLVAFGLVAFFALLILVTRGRGMGSGDVPLTFLIGLILSWPLSIIAMFLSFLCGAVFSIVLLVLGAKKFGQTIPFGPFLAIGAIVSMFWGQAILSWYLSLIR